MIRINPPERRFDSGKTNLRSGLARHQGLIKGAPWIVVSLAFVAGGFVLQDTAHNARAADPETLCSIETPVTDTIVVLVDRTDPLTTANAPKFQRLVVGLGENAPRGSRLTIVPFDGDAGAPLNPIFDVCSPGDGRVYNRWIESRRYMQQAYEEKFGAPLRQAVASLSEASVSEFSPITRQIERAARDPTLWPTGSRRRLVLISDYLENTPAASVYRPEPFSLPAPRSRFLEGVEVVMVELGNSRDAGLQSEVLRQQWVSWFEAAGATVEAGYLEPGPWAS